MFTRAYHLIYFIIFLFLISCSYTELSRKPSQLFSRNSGSNTADVFVKYKEEQFSKFREELSLAYPGYENYYGGHTKSRILLHEKILKPYFKRLRSFKLKKKEVRPKVYWTMGVYGSGKSYVLKKLGELGVIDLDNYVVIDPDQFKKYLPEFKLFLEHNPSMAGTVVHHESGYLASIFLEMALSKNKNIIIDGSLHDYVWFQTQLESIKKRYPQYETGLIDTNVDKKVILKRVEKRNLISKRKIPINEVLKNFNKVAYVREKAYKMVDTVIEIANSKEIPILNGIYRFSDMSNLLYKPIPLNFESRYLLKNIIQKVKYFLKINISKKYTIVFDLDWTLFYTVNEAMKGRSHVYEVNGVYYRLTDHAISVISNLHKRKNVQIAFFSGGTKDRNTALLKQVMLDDGTGRSLFDISGGRVFSFDNLKKRTLNAKLNKGAKFWKRYSKDLSLIDHDLGNILIVEDIQGFSHRGQEANMAFLGNTYNYYETWDDAKNAIEDKADYFNKYVPPTKDEFYLERNKLVWKLGLIDEALERSIHDDVDLVEAYNELIKDENKMIVPRSYKYHDQFYKSGFSHLGLEYHGKGGVCSKVLNESLSRFFNYFKS